MAAVVAGLVLATEPAGALPAPVEDSAISLALDTYRGGHTGFGPLPRHVLIGLVLRAGLTTPRPGLPPPDALVPPTCKAAPE